VERPYPIAAGGGRRSYRHGLLQASVRGGLFVGRLCLRLVRPLPRATIGNQITLLSLVTTIPFLLLLIFWSVQDRQGAAHTIAGLIWATVAAIGLGILSHRRLSMPIEQLARTAQQIGEGDFTVRAPFQRADELGELAAAMDVMTASIQELTAELRDTRDRVVHTVTEVGRLASSGVDTEELWPLLADIARRLTSADGSALYLRDDSGSLRLAATAGVTVWPARGDLAGRFATEACPEEEPQPVWADQRMAVPLVVNQQTAAVLEVYRRETPFAEDTGRLLAVFARQAGLTIERTDLRRRAAAAYAWEQTSRTQSEFIAMASHELRNPVASLHSYAEALSRQDVVLDAAEQRYCLERVEHLSGRLGDIVRNLLSASRIRSGALRAELTAVDLHTLMQGVANDTRRRAPSRTIVEVVGQPVPPALADPVLLEEILINLLSNALAYSPPESAVCLAAETVTVDSGLRVRLHVRDDGPGLSRDQQSRLFQGFVCFGSEKPEGGESGGLGLGLYICQAYARLMQGNLSVRSEVGCGSTFTVDLPAAEEASGAHA
jgi:signal transduction histidine kinase/HAMP domain-containing protein